MSHGTAQEEPSESTGGLQVTRPHVVVTSTKTYLSDLSALTGEAKARVESSLKVLVSGLESGKSSAESQLRRVLLHISDEYKAALFELRVTNQIRVFMTITGDPINDRTLMNLRHIGPPHEGAAVIASLTNQLRAEFGNLRDEQASES